MKRPPLNVGQRALRSRHRVALRRCGSPLHGFQTREHVVEFVTDTLIDLLGLVVPHLGEKIMVIFLRTPFEMFIESRLLRRLFGRLSRFAGGAG